MAHSASTQKPPAGNVIAETSLQRFTLLHRSRARKEVSETRRECCLSSRVICVHCCHGLGRCSCLTRLKTAAVRSSVSVSRVIWGDSRLVHPRNILSCGQSKAHWSSCEHHCASPFCQQVSSRQLWDLWLVFSSSFFFILNKSKIPKLCCC